MEDGHLHRLGLGQRSWRGARALDVGAAPGGWTQYLSEEACVARVLAVDGGRLHPGVLARRAVVRHAGCRVQDAAAGAAMAEEVRVGVVWGGGRSRQQQSPPPKTTPRPPAAAPPSITTKIDTPHHYHTPNRAPSTWSSAT